MRPGRSCPPELRSPAAFADHPPSVCTSGETVAADTLPGGPFRGGSQDWAEGRLVGLPCHPVHARSGLAFERKERRPECVGVDMVEKCGEPLLLFTLRLAVRGSAPGSRASGSESGACFADLRFPWPLPLAPPPPPPAARLCSAASQLLWQGLTSPDRASAATAPHLPAADRRPNRAVGRSGDLPVPVHGACVHARFFDHAGSPKCLRWRSWTYCLPLHRQRRHPEPVFSRGSMAGVHVPLPTLRRHPRGCLRTARGRCGCRVEVPVTRHLLHRSRRAAFPHRALVEGQTRSWVWTPPIRRLAASVTC